METRLLILAALVLSGCSASYYTASKEPSIVYPRFEVYIQSKPQTLPIQSNSVVNGTAMMMTIDGKRICVINLREYPRCLLHEIRHCIEGHWHPDDIPNSEDC